MVSTTRQMTMVPMMMGLPRSSLTVCFSLFSVMVLSEIFRVPPKEIFMPFAPMVVTVRSEPGLMQAQKGLVQKKPSRLMVP